MLPSRLLLRALTILLLGWHLPLSAAPLSCGIALGYPPYQYRELDEAQGFDAVGVSPPRLD